VATSVDRAGEARPYGADGILGRRVATHLGGVWRGALRGAWRVAALLRIELVPRRRVSTTAPRPL